MRRGIAIVIALGTVSAAMLAVVTLWPDSDPSARTPFQEATRRLDQSSYTASYDLRIENASDPCVGTLIWHFDGSARQFREQHCRIGDDDEKVTFQVVQDGRQIDCDADRKVCEETGIRLSAWSDLAEANSSSVPPFPRIIAGETARCFGDAQRHFCFAEDGPLLGWRLADGRGFSWEITAKSVVRGVEGVSFDPPYRVLRFESSD